MNQKNLWSVMAGMFLLGGGVLALQWRQGEVTGRQAAALERLTGAMEGLGVAADGRARAAGQEAPLPKRLNRTLDLAASWFAARVENPAVAAQDKVTFLDAAICLSYSPNVETRNGAIQTLARLGGEAAEKRLLEMTGKGDLTGRVEAVKALRATGNPKAGETILSWLRDGGSAEVRLAGSGLIGGRLLKESVPLVLELLKNLPAEDKVACDTRENLYRALQQANDPRLCPVLLDLMQEEGEAGARRAAAMAILRNATRREFDLVVKTFDLAGLAAGDAVEVQPALLANLVWFGNSQNLKATALLLPYLKARNGKVQLVAAQALVRLRDPEAASPLVELAAASKDPAVRTELESAVRNGFPGLRLDAGKVATVPAAELQALLEARRARLDRLSRPGGELPPPAAAAGADADADAGGA